MRLTTVSLEARGGHQVPWSWSYRPLPAALHGPSATMLCALNHCAVSLDLHLCFLMQKPPRHPHSFSGPFKVSEKNEAHQGT